MNKPTTRLFSGLTALLAAFLLAACFGENPVKPVESSKPKTTQKKPGQLTLDTAKTLVRGKDFEKAMEYYERAIEQDSTLSQAYLGYADAAAHYYGLDVQEFLEDVKAASNGNPGVFANYPDSVLTQRLQAATEITRVLDALVNRDTLSTAKNPLTDGKVDFEKIAVELAAYKFLNVMSQAFDIDGNGIVDAADLAILNVSDGSLSGLGALAGSMQADPVLQANVNRKIVELHNGLSDVRAVLAVAGATSGPLYEAKVLMEGAVAGLGGSLMFYQFGDARDNDGDGCIDEEILDSIDNDLDGFVDEDARLINGNGGSTGVADGVDNDHNGIKDAADSGENKLGGSTASRDLLAFVALSGHGENWIKTKQPSTNLALRIQIQKDSLAVPGRSSLPGYAAKLQAAKDQVGGCWRNY